MPSDSLLTGVFVTVFAGCVLFVTCFRVDAQASAAMQGRVIDPSGAVVAGASITVRNRATGLERSTWTDGEGNYLIPALPVGAYRVAVRAQGFHTQVVENLIVEVGQSTVQDFQVQMGDILQEVTITPASQAVERTSISVGHVVNRQMVQELPLNGRYFLDLGLLVPGSVTPPQGAFSAAPMRGLGSLAFNTAGNREETVNYILNGITLNNLTFSSITFQPSINTIQEFRVENSTVSAEFGQSSGATVNIATRSGATDFHGELFEFLRNDAFDARNFFNFTSHDPPPFRRNQFGGNLGGPLVKGKVFFLFSYEGLRQRQALDLNSLVLSAAQRASTNDPVIRELIKLIPRANFVDSSGTPRFIGSASAPVDEGQWTGDIGYNIGRNDRLHAYYAFEHDQAEEPTRFGNTVPGFGYRRSTQRQILTVGETHIFSEGAAGGTGMVNETRFGVNRLNSITTPKAELNPETFGILDGIKEAIGLPQMNVAGGSLNFGGPSNFPSGRADTTFVVGDTLNLLKGRHALKLGGEFREFLNNSFRQGTGSFNFPTVAAFLANTANSFSVTLGNQSSSISEGALGFFIQDNFKWRPNITLELGLRYEWNMTPTERYDRFVVFDPRSASLVRAGADFDEVYHQNYKNVQPRFGFAWDPLGDGKTSVRGAYALLTDQPMTSVVTSTAANPPLAIPLAVAGTIRLDNAINLARAAGLSPQSVDQGFNNAYMQNWNLNVQRELRHNLGVTVGYFGSKGSHLILRRNINQPVKGVRPYPALSASSAILPGTPLGNITQAEASGSSSYNSLWVTGNQRLKSGLQFNVSYTWSKSLDYNSFSSQGIVVQNSDDPQGDAGLSDFDARHRFVASAIYELPSKGSRLADGWEVSAIVQAQSGNPFNIVTSDGTVNGVAGTLRPDMTGPVNIIGSVERWFDTSVFTPVARFGNLGRNVVIGPGFNNTDFSISKKTKLREGVGIQFRAEFFDVFNHANFGQPGNVVGAPAFGRIASTRFPTGESGSSRQMQFALKVVF